MKVTITEVFCETISGLAVMLVLLPILQLACVVSLSFPEMLIFLARNVTGASMVAIAAIAYITGVAFDAVGMLADLKLIPCFNSKEPGVAQKRIFWKHTTAHVLQYRSEQWAYYFCYRNLLLLGILAIPLWSIALTLNGNWVAALVVSFVLIFVCYALSVAAKEILSIYHEITNAIEAPPNAG